MPPLIEKQNTRDWYLSSFKTFENNLNGERRSPFHRIRKDAIGRFEELDFPTSRNEEWKYTNVSPILKFRFRPSLQAGVEPGVVRGNTFLVPGLQANVFVFINGHYSKELSHVLPQSRELRVDSLSALLKTDPDVVLPSLGRFAGIENGFQALNTAFVQDGAVIRIPDGLVVEGPIFLVFIAGSATETILSQPRNLILAGKNSHAIVIEHYQGFSHQPYLTNAVTEILLDESSNLEYYRIQNENANAYHISKTHVEQKRNSHFDSYTVSFDGAIIRNDLVSVLSAEGADSNLYGLYVTQDEQLVDNITVLDHASPHCTSNEFYKGILSGSSRGVFNGKIRVRKDAQKTVSYQSNKNLLLSNEALVDTKPQLEIFADDVKCSHGAAIGQLEEDALFYLRSRGIDDRTARSLLVTAFAGDILGQIKLVPLQVYLHNIVLFRMKRESRG